MERFAGGNPGHLPSEPGAAQGTHRGGVKGIGCGLHHQDLDGLELSHRDRRRHRRWLHRVNGFPVINPRPTGGGGGGGYFEPPSRYLAMSSKPM